MVTLESASRLGCLFAFSVVAGAFIGIAAASAMLPIDGGRFGSIFGAAIGALVSPVVMAALFRKPMAGAAMLVFVPSIVVAMIAGRSLNPAVTLLSVVVYCAMAAVCFLILPDVYPEQRGGRCVHCGYDVTGLTQCPECGGDPRASREGSRPGRVTAAWAIIIAGVLLPLLLAILAAVEARGAS